MDIFKDIKFNKQITVVLGHYGSGKTEFSINLAMFYKSIGNKTALVDLDIANVYFRSREKQNLLVDKGIDVYAGAYRHEITAEMPAIDSGIKKPLEDISCRTVIDVGGDQSGARILMQFQKYLARGTSEMLCVINANRPETETAEGAVLHIERIEQEIGMKINGLVNNTHLLKETRIEDILKGKSVCDEISELLGIPVKCHCCVENLIGKLEKFRFDGDRFVICPIKLYMRPSWLDA